MKAKAILAAVVLATAAASATPDQQKLITANSAFAFKLLKEIAREQPAQNLFISPYSVSTVLQMVGNGATGKTKQEMQETLGTTAIPASVQNAANRDLSRLLESRDTNLVLTIANAVWYRQGLPVKPQFIAANQEFYQAAVRALDFNNPASVNTINSWCREQTHGRIPGMLSGPIDPLTQLFLANAVYFKGKWETPFEVKDTKDRGFHLRGGKEKKVPMMFRNGDFSYRRGSGYQAVRLPYQGWEVGMYVFLPDAGSSPEELLAIMNGDNWERVTVPGFQKREGTLRLPRFKFELGVDLKQPLTALGIRSAFNVNTANFSDMCSEPVFISRAWQKAFVEVNEQGTEAAAVTMVTAQSKGIAHERPKPFEMIVDRPFLFAIEHTASKTILFMGIVHEPNEM
jgi:serine protease inhibitor